MSKNDMEQAEFCETCPIKGYCVGGFTESNVQLTSTTTHSAAQHPGGAVAADSGYQTGAAVHMSIVDRNGFASRPVEASITVHKLADVIIAANILSRIRRCNGTGDEECPALNPTVLAAIIQGVNGVGAPIAPEVPNHAPGNLFRSGTPSRSEDEQPRRALFR